MCIHRNIYDYKPIHQSDWHKSLPPPPNYKKHKTLNHTYYIILRTGRRLQGEEGEGGLLHAFPSFHLPNDELAESDTTIFALVLMVFLSSVGICCLCYDPERYKGNLGGGGGKGGVLPELERLVEAATVVASPGAKSTKSV